MKCEIRGDKSVAKTIIELTAQWDSAVGDCDAERMMENYLEDVEIYDVGSQLVGRENLKDLWRNCFPYFGESPEVYRRRVKLYASDSLAFLHFYSKVCGSNQASPEDQPWCRTTVCFHKPGDDWLVVHEHISMPIDFEKGAPALIFGQP